MSPNYRFMRAKSMQTRSFRRTFTALIVPVAIGLIPVWLWITDLNSRSLLVQIVTQTALQPEGASTLSGLKVTIDGKELEAPYLTVLRIENSGARPIAASDFESPMEIKPLGQIKIYQHRVSETYPKDLQPITELVPSDTTLKLRPLLLNPSDSITVSLVTSGGLPEFTVGSRIAGISSVEMEKSEETPISRVLFWLLATVSFALLIVYSQMSWGFSGQRGFTLRPRMTFFSALTALAGSTLLFFINIKISTNLDLEWWKSLSIFILTLLPAMWSGFLINRKSGNKEQQEIGRGIRDGGVSS